MSGPNAGALFRFLYDQDFNFQSIWPGYYYYDDAEKKYAIGGPQDTAVGTLEYVTHWNGFNEGNEDIYIVFKIGETLYLAELYNDSWSGDGSHWEIQSIDEVQEKPVTKIEYVKV